MRINPTLVLTPDEIGQNTTVGRFKSALDFRITDDTPGGYRLIEALQLKTADIFKLECGSKQ